MQCDLFDVATVPAPAGGVAAPGSIVGARRWPLSGAHPDCWRRPHKGCVLDVRDARAWLNKATGQHMDAAQIDAYLTERQARGQLLQSIPVLWDFGSVGAGTCVMWEYAPNLRPYDEDLAQWREVREQAKAREAARGS